MNNFDTWFEAQHGPRPHPHSKDAELVARINAGIEAEAMMRACEMYDAKRKSALYAWTANTYCGQNELVRSTTMTILRPGSEGFKQQNYPITANGCEAR